MIAIFINSAFDNELRLECNRMKVNTKKDGEICILPKYYNTVFEVSDATIVVSSEEKEKKIKVIGNGIVKVDNDNIYCFGRYEEA